MKRSILAICLLVYTINTWSQTQKIIAYFNRPVNNSVSSGTNVVYLNNLVDDTLIAYINRAKYTIDVAVYSFNETSGISSISAAINNAYARGVAIRWIYDGSSSNPSVPLLNSNIKTLASPSSSLYGIMHNKFMIIDANSANTEEPVLWTGSTNWTTQQINTDANNVIIIQDKDVALAYTSEFNEMWGSSGLVPDTAVSKFGPFKTDNTPHSFNVDGTLVEVYFSPTDGINSKLQQAIGSANYDLYFGIYAFTNGADGDSIASRIRHGVYTAGIMDPFSQSYPPFTTLSPLMGTKLIKDNITGLYHSKLLIVDPSSPGSDPLVFTGSYNWSASAETKNDENVVIVHSPTIANIYYQSFNQNFTDEGGSLVVQSAISSPSKPDNFTIFLNPCNTFTTIKAGESSFLNHAEITIFNIVGEQVYPSISKDTDSFIIDTGQLPAGLFLVRIKSLKTTETVKLQVVR